VSRWHAGVDLGVGSDVGTVAAEAGAGDLPKSWRTSPLLASSYRRTIDADSVGHG